jgi:hypothetical protein
MPRRKPTQGTCAYCGETELENQMTKHLATCPKRRAVIAKVERRKANREKLYHLRVQDAWGGDFWLDLEMRGTATLQDLDHYLRAIWLECCGHMSRFSIGGWKGEEIAKTQSVEQVFKRGITLTHIYDFGTSSETLVRFVETREGIPSTAHPIALMARNVIPKAYCIECKQPAVWLCMECVVEEEIWGFLCQSHVKSHPHKEYGKPIRIVNSPRLGLCGYEGPANPPY